MLGITLSLLLASATANAPAPMPKTVAVAPADAPTDEDAMSPVEVARMRARHAHYVSFTDQLARSTSPRDWALASQVLDFGEYLESHAWNRHGDLLRKAAAAAPGDRVVQWLWARADESGIDCDAKRPCPERQLAAARLEPDNAAAWLIAFPKETADPQEIDRALRQIASLPRYQDETIELWEVWTELYRKYPMPPEPNEGEPGLSDPGSMAIVMGISQAAMGGMPPTSLFRVCNRMQQPKAAPSRFEDCARIGKLMVEQADNMLSERLGAVLQRIASPDPGAFAERQRRMNWRWRQYMQISIGHATDPIELQAFYRDLVETHSEIRAQELALTRAGIALEPPADWIDPDPGQ